MALTHCCLEQISSLGNLGIGHGNPSSSHPTTEPGVGPPGGNQGFPDELDIHTVPPELKKEGSDWWAIFNPKVKRQLDVTLVHSLMHERSDPFMMNDVYL